MEDNTQRRVHGFLSGRVQGVFFRASMRDKARDLGVAGWVRNLRDGRVEFVAEGDTEAVQQLVEWARVGPPHASVTDVELDEEPPTDSERYFRIRR